MKPKTTEDVLDLLAAYLPAAALGAAMELGLFWLLADKPHSAPHLATALHIPLNRCNAWLRLLADLGLLDETQAGYAPSPVAREAILEAQSRHFWAFHAREDRQASRLVRDMAVNIRLPTSDWADPPRSEPDYFQRIVQDPVYAVDFTRMLCEIHLPLAERLAGMLDMAGVRRLMDVGGGSGVVSLALLRRWPELSSVVVDTANVCAAGRAIAAENGLDTRITYLAADILHDSLPGGFDMALLCDVGFADQALFRRVLGALNPGGRLAIVEKLAPNETDGPPSRLPAGFVAAMESPGESWRLTVETVRALLAAVGFGAFSSTPIPAGDLLPWNLDWTLIQARA